MLGLDAQPKTASSLKSLKAAMSDVPHYPAQLGHPDEGRAIKGLVVCYVVMLGSIIYGMGLWPSAKCPTSHRYIQIQYKNRLLNHKLKNTPK